MTCCIVVGTSAFHPESDQAVNDPFADEAFRCDAPTMRKLNGAIAAVVTGTALVGLVRYSGMFVNGDSITEGSELDEACREMRANDHHIICNAVYFKENEVLFNGSLSTLGEIERQMVLFCPSVAPPIFVVGYSSAQARHRFANALEEFLSTHPEISDHCVVSVGK